MKILVLNSGSSSQKSCLYEIGDALPDDPPARLWEATIEWNGESAKVEIKNAKDSPRLTRPKFPHAPRPSSSMLDTLWNGEASVVESPSKIDVVGHRVVHGGPQFEDPILISSEVKHAIAAVSAFAPLHNRAELEGVEIIEKLMGPVPQVAVFDTGFHKRMPLSAAVYPGPTNGSRRNPPLWFPRYQSQVLCTPCRATACTKI